MSPGTRRAWPIRRPPIGPRTWRPCPRAPPSATAVRHSPAPCSPRSSPPCETPAPLIPLWRGLVRSGGVHHQGRVRRRDLHRRSLVRPRDVLGGGLAYRDHLRARRAADPAVPSNNSSARSRSRATPKASTSSTATSPRGAPRATGPSPPHGASPGSCSPAPPTCATGTPSYRSN